MEITGTDLRGRENKQIKHVFTIIKKRIMKKGFSFLLFALLCLQATAQQSNDITTNESNGLTYMREEEKLARDVYDSMYAKWDVNPFGNIRQSERVHMDRMKTLMTRYEVKDPVDATGDKPGVFKTAVLQKVYNQLVKSGTASLTDALKAGAKIEELDIADLDERIAQTKKEDILTAYKFLRMGSENHLRAFVRRLKSQGVDYQPEFLKKDMFDAIISGENQDAGCGNGPGNGQGQGKGLGQGQRKGNGPGNGNGAGNGPCKEKCCDKENGPGCQSKNN